jgi:hypothetical protein
MIGGSATADYSSLIRPANDARRANTSTNQKSRQAHPRKIFRFRFSEIHDYPLAIPPPLEGRIAIVTDVGSGMRWT